MLFNQFEAKKALQLCSTCYKDRKSKAQGLQHHQEKDIMTEMIQSTNRRLFKEARIKIFRISPHSYDTQSLRLLNFNEAYLSQD